MSNRQSNGRDKENNPDSLLDYMRAQVFSGDIHNQLPPIEALKSYGSEPGNSERHHDPID